MNETIKPIANEPGEGLPRLAFSVRETARMLGVSEKTVRRLVVRGLLHPSRALRHLLIPRSEIVRFLHDTL
jgi:excisionase family DNA binding protein